MRDGAACHFIPHEKNGFVPHVLKHRVLFGYSAILVLLKVLLIVGYAALPVASVFSSAVTGENVIRLTNVARAAAGLSELVPNDHLAAAAANKAADMLTKQYFAHESPEGLTPWYWIRGAGYDYRYAGENLAVHYFSAEGVQEGWMASPTHRQNILDDRYVDVGIGVAQGTYENYDTIFVVQMFGRLKGYGEAVPTTDVVLLAEEVPTTPTEHPGSSPQEVPTGEPEVAGEVSPTVAEPAQGGEDERPETESLFPGSVPVASPVEPIIDESSVKVVPNGDGYDVAVKVDNAESAAVFLGPQVAELEEQDDGSFAGFIAHEDGVPGESGVAQVFVSAEDADGDRIIRSVATVAPNGTTQDLFVAGGRPTGTVKFLGVFAVNGLEDGVKRFYMFSIVFLTAALLLKIFVKFHIQRHGVILHTLAVIGLASALLLV
jgi:hypothetical protein